MLTVIDQHPTLPQRKALAHLLLYPHIIPCGDYTPEDLEELAQIGLCEYDTREHVRAFYPTSLILDEGICYQKYIQMYHEVEGYSWKSPTSQAWEMAQNMMNYITEEMGRGLALNWQKWAHLKVIVIRS